VCLLPLTCWDCGLESCRWHICLFLGVVGCQVDVSVIGRSLFKRRPIECGEPERDREASKMRKPRPTRSGLGIKTYNHLAHITTVTGFWNIRRAYLVHQCTISNECRAPPQNLPKKRGVAAYRVHITGRPTDDFFFLSCVRVS